MDINMPEEFRKRETAYKVKIGDLLRANQVFEQSEALNKRLQFVELGDRKILRINLIANVIDKFESEGESKFATITLDDGSGQIRARVFGMDINKFQDINQGDTLLIVGLLRSYNQELYIMPEIIKKQDPKYLLVRKLELEKLEPKQLTPAQKQEVKSFRDQIVEKIKLSESNEGIDKDDIIMSLKNANPKIISEEIQKLLEEGIIYEPRPGRVRYLG
jgi:RPA family protein